MLSKIQQIVKSLFRSSENKIEQKGSSNLAFQGITNSTFDIKQTNISDSHYENWKQQLETEKNYFARLREDEIEEKIKTGERISLLEENISKYEEKIVKLAEEINNRNNPKSNRLNSVRELINRGKIGEAREFYQSKLDEIYKEEKSIIKRKKVLSEDYLILALLTQTDFYNPKLFEETKNYYLHSIKLHKNKDNVFKFAYFLQEHERFTEAKKYYEYLLNELNNQLSLAEREIIHNNLGNSYASLYDTENAKNHLNQALKIRKESKEKNPLTYLQDVSTTIYNLAKVYLLEGNKKDAEINYKRALKLRQKLFNSGQENQKYFIADITMSLGTLYSDIAQEKDDNDGLLKARDYFLEALEIYQTLIKDKNFISFHIALCLDNLTIVYQRLRDFNKALEACEKAHKLFQVLVKANSAYKSRYAGNLHLLGQIKADLKDNTAIYELKKSIKIFSKLELESPKAFLPNIGIALKTIALYYSKNVPDQDKAVWFAIESMIVLNPFLKTAPRLNRYYNAALMILFKWGLSK